MLINKSVTRQRILDKIKQNRLGWNCTRVSDAVLIQLDAWVDAKLDRMVHSHPSTGKTFKEFI